MLAVLSRSPPAGPCSSSFFFNDTATTEIYTLSLHDALPILKLGRLLEGMADPQDPGLVKSLAGDLEGEAFDEAGVLRSEEHTSELQSHLNLVCRLLLEKKKNVEHLQQCEVPHRC